ncbi:hypothetical protein PSN45_000357 [Yamadazyma tenuis]|uniref:Phox-like protein n=1 Tax=Candida tenuis (strain ATCC 10573 / BCRC 21748 / CBS 615 / JCM 9827 / NBRC 10315 / NRRL Y-1498 / VKM Y-70) TaxID=590646 RepID=G3B7W5_CANTC|nr:uncharacterized protein CANTEDRAFT_135611 [Yamadazyma tenuis ATCC 10573]EGV61674.1 hypothetical protein CANTEDRAFT_135611 [Yamadazyma tenuis ATCC 10573]WEJ92899.1 hypothetical protein PSN45_000357 [Yamadazyma tenuis]
MSKVITINSTSVSNNTTYYRIDIKIPLRSLTVSRRYSEFDDLLKTLSQSLGIDSKDFPYKLPAKSSIFTKNSASTISERKQGLEDFLNALVADRELQNIPSLHEFLHLPVMFKFSPSMFKSKDSSIGNLVISDPQSIDSTRWLEFLRLFKSNVNKLMETYNEDPSINNKINIRSKIQSIVKPNMVILAQRLDELYSSGTIEEQEYQRRKLISKELTHEIEGLYDVIEGGSKPSTNVSDFSKRSLLDSRRVIGARPVETKKTIPLNNRELLQHQIQIHRTQDQELEGLRKIIARQKEIGLTINQEVEEQNEMLDSLNDQVELTTDKLRHARNKAKNIL